MYYLVKEDNKIRIKISKHLGHRGLEDIGYEIVGRFGRKDYAEHWRDYKNGLLTESEHRKFLGL